jgi:hypothetical protein
MSRLSSLRDALSLRGINTSIVQAASDGAVLLTSRGEEIGITLTDTKIIIHLSDRTTSFARNERDRAVRYLLENLR